MHACASLGFNDSHVHASISVVVRVVRRYACVLVRVPSVVLGRVLVSTAVSICLLFFVRPSAKELLIRALVHTTFSLIRVQYVNFCQTELLNVHTNAYFEG